MSKAEVPTENAEKGKQGAHMSASVKGGKIFSDRDGIVNSFMIAMEQAYTMVTRGEGNFEDCLRLVMIRDGDLRTLVIKRPQAAGLAVKNLPRSHKLFRKFILEMNQSQPLARRDEKWRKKR